MATLSIELKQHTPLIHFQHLQVGSKLRASDLKPRIDKHLGLGYKPKYKLNIVSILEYSKNPPLYQPYWGEYNLCMYKDITLNFNTYFNSYLEGRIRDILPKVFALENFGSFGNKGYGCFTIEGQSQSDFEVLLKSKYNPIYYWLPDTKNSDEIFFQIKYFYALLKAGINIRNKDRNVNKETYYKSLLMEYFRDVHPGSSDPIRWEKRGIKKFFLLPDTNNRQYLDDNSNSIPNDEDYKAIKPLFGYSKSQEWQSYGLRKNRKIGIEFPNGIDRINSPLFFKVYIARNNNEKTKVYFMLKNNTEYVNRIYPNKDFNYRVFGRTKDYRTPEIFDYADFLNIAVNKINSGLTYGSATGGVAKKVDEFFKSLNPNGIASL